MRNIKVSVVMPVLNGMPYFQQALDSVRQQTLPEIEIIVVDAGSIDGTQEYVNQCQQEDARIQFLSTDKKSMGYQYNLGIAAAQGEYIGFCESDDYVDARMFAALYAAAAKQAFPDCVKADYIMFFDQEGREFSLYCPVLSREQTSLYGKVIATVADMTGLWIRNNTIWNGIYHCSFLRQAAVRFDETPGAAFQDLSFLLQVYLWTKRWLFIPEAYYHYRRDNPGSSMNQKGTFLFVCQQVHFKLQYLERHPEQKELYGAMILAAQLEWIFRDYGREKYYDNTATLEAMVDSLQRETLDFFQSLSYAARSSLTDVTGLLFIYEPQVFRRLASTCFEQKSKDTQAVWGALMDEALVVIFGTGADEQCLCAGLVRRGYLSKLFFCEAAIDKSSSVLMGYPVYSLPEVVQRHPRAVFAIADGWDKNERRQALLAAGITSERIFTVSELRPNQVTGGIDA